jgi:asparagine synthase (glutamine-hydrolysing)
VQPAVRDDIVVLLDGWIYDHEALALAADDGPPAEFDVEALVRAWRRWGPDTFQRLEGEFAIALWDRAARQLHLVRDRLGVRPLFWARRGDKIAFASEIPALTQVPWVSRELDRANLSEYLSFQVVHAPRTLLEDVQQVQAAHHVTLGMGTEHVRRWWRLKYAPIGAPRPSETEVIQAVEQAMVRAVRRRVPRGVETGLYLSGGLGSTAIGEAARQQHLQLPSFTVSFSDDLYPESPFAGRVASLLGLEHHPVEVGTAELAREFDAAVAMLGHPVGHPGVVLQAALARAARQRVPVVLSGDGAEELFGGRMLDRLGGGLAVSRVMGRLPGVLRGPVGRLTGMPDPTKTPVDWVLDLEFGGHRLFDARDRGRLLRDHGLVRPDIRRVVLSRFYEGLETDAVNAALHGSLCSWLAESDLVRADRTAAAAGLDLRFPLLDRDVLETAALLPGSSKVRRVRGSLHTRWPLRAMVKGTLPAALLNRPKRGLPKPLDNWLEGPGRLFMEERFARLRQDTFGLWRPDALDQLRRDLARRAGAGIRLWTLFVLDAWLHGLTE